MRHISQLSSAILLAAMATAAPAADGLVSVKVAAPVQLDGVVEAAWEQAPAMKLVLDKTPYKPEDYKGMTSTEIVLKSAYDAENVYFLLQYKDPTRSVARAPWVKQADGTWKQLKQVDATGHDNTHYEDKLSILWDINARGFAKLGCAVVCHATVNGKLNGIDEKSPGRKYTNKPGETVDMWHWKGVRTGAVGQVDDQFINDNKPADEKNWGRRSDEKTGGGYEDNISADKSGPAFMSGKPDAENPYWIRDEDKVPFVDTFKPGDIVGGIIVKPFAGSRGDISSAAKWENGTWTIEMKRKLVTTGDKVAEQDVQFSDLGKAYAFGVAVFDNAQINHLYHGGAPKLTFKP
jgi:hypothetical protein